MSPRANWSYPTAIRFGAGRISELAEACAVAGMITPVPGGTGPMTNVMLCLNVLEAARQQA